MRLFYAVFPPPKVQEALAVVQEKVKGYKGWKLSQPDQLHITLLFLGETPPERLRGLLQVGKDAAAGVQPFEVQLGGTGYFPASGSPRVWFVKAEGAGLEPLALNLRQALPDIEVKEKFHPHLTLARKKGPAPRVGPVVLDLKFEAKALCLVESTLDPKGSQYRIVERFGLKDAGVGMSARKALS